MIAYLFLSYGLVATGAFAFGQGLFIDLLSGGLNGLFAFLYLSVFGGIYMGSRVFELNHPKGQVLLVSSATLLKRIIFFAAVVLFSKEAVFSTNFMFASLGSAVSTGLLAPVLFYLLNHLRGGFSKDDPGASPGGHLLAVFRAGALPRQTGQDRKTKKPKTRNHIENIRF